MEKEMNNILGTVITSTHRVYRILGVVFKLMLFQMTTTNSKTCKNFNW